MTIKLQLLLLIMSIITLFIMFNMIRKYSVELKYSLLWIAINLVIILLAAFPGLLYLLSDALGIEAPSNTLFLCGIIGCYAISFSFTVAFSRASNRINKLTQEIGLIKKEIESLKRQNDE